METTASTPITASQRLHAAFAAARGLDLPDTAVGLLRAGLDVAEIVRTLDADDDVAVPALLLPVLPCPLIGMAGAWKLFSADAHRLVPDVYPVGRIRFPAELSP